MRMQISFKAYIIRFNINEEQAKIVKKSMVFSYREGRVSDSRDADGKRHPAPGGKRYGVRRWWNSSSQMKNT